MLATRATGALNHNPQRRHKLQSSAAAVSLRATVHGQQRARAMLHFHSATHGAHVTYGVPRAQAATLSALLCGSDAPLVGGDYDDLVCVAHRAPVASGKCKHPVEHLSLHAPEMSVIAAVLPALRTRASLSNTPVPWEWEAAAARDAAVCDARGNQVTVAAQCTALSPALATLSNVLFAALRIILVEPSGVCSLYAPCDPTRYGPSLTMFLMEHTQSPDAPASANALLSLVCFRSEFLAHHARVPYLIDSEWRIGIHA